MKKYQVQFRVFEKKWYNTFFLSLFGNLWCGDFETDVVSLAHLETMIMDRIKGQD